LIFRNKMAQFPKKKIAPSGDRHNDVAASGESNYLGAGRSVTAPRKSPPALCLGEGVQL
jgi:hypothetical protein